MNYDSRGLGASPAARETQVREQMNRLEKAIAKVADVRGRVEDRISAILRPSAPCLGEAAGKDKAQSVPLAQELERLTELVNSIAFMDEALIERIEL